MSTSSSTKQLLDVAELKDMVRALILDRKNQTPASAPVKAVEQSCVTCGGGHSYQNCPATNSNMYHAISKSMCPGRCGHFNKLILVIRPRWSPINLVLWFSLPNPIQNPQQILINQEAHQDLPSDTGVLSKTDFERYVTANDAVLRNMQNQGQNLQSQMANLTDMLSKFVTANTASTSGSGTLPGNTITNPKEDLKASIPFPSRRNDEKRKEKANDQNEKFYEIFRDLSFEISFTDALMLMPKFASTLKTLIGNKEKLSELARTPLNENCSAVILNKLPKKLGGPWAFSDSYLALPELTPTCMTLELADRSITEPIGIAKDVRLMVGKFQFPADFVVVDFEPDPRVPLILGRCFLKTSHALIDVYEGEITLRVGKEAITFNLDQTSKYTADYNHMTVNKIDVIDMACDEYSQEVLGFSNVIATYSFLALEDDPTSSEVDPTYQDPEGDILILEAILNSEPPPLPNHEQYMPGGRKELKLCEAKSSVDEPPEVELKELPPHLEYAFLEGDDKLPVIIAKDLKDEEKAALLKVLKSHK
ncbi:reverse transcriptase domain-containing protein [Tanacetum coccineum]